MARTPTRVLKVGSIPIGSFGPIGRFFKYDEKSNNNIKKKKKKKKGPKDLDCEMVTKPSSRARAISLYRFMATRRSAYKA
jgi:hypothetical protein